MINRPDKKEGYDVLSEDLLRVIARLKGHAPRKGVPVAASVLYPVSTAARKAEEEFIKNLKPGQEAPGRGIYLGKYAPQDHSGRSLGKIFNVYAAPEDLMENSGRAQRTYKNTVACLSTLRNWNGHDGAAYENDTELYTALGNGSYKGEWVIPPCELLTGHNANGDAIQQDHLLGHKNAGSLKDTFGQAGDYLDNVFPDWYWSCTESPNRYSILIACFSSDANRSSDTKDNKAFSCRPVRLELAS